MSVEFIKKYLKYDYKIDELVWIDHWRIKGLIGKIAGKNGRLMVINREKFNKRDIVFMLTNGYSSKYVEHIDGDKQNFSTKNLRCIEHLLCEQEITQELIKGLLKYDENSGYFYWKVNSPAGNMKTGKLAGTRDSLGYMRIKIFGKVIFYHHLVYIYTQNRFLKDKEVIDHINRNPSDNRLENLRITSMKMNCRNRSTGKTSLSGMRGIKEMNSGNFIVYTGHEKIGIFNNKEEAIKARKEAEERLGYII